MFAAALSAGASTGARPDAVAVKAAVGAVGTPYTWGGASPKTGFDSSGLVAWASAKAGIRGLPHASGALWTRGYPISRNVLRPGDLVFFNNAEHVGIYIGRGRFVHATHTGSTVKIARLAGSFERNCTGAVRISWTAAIYRARYGMDTWMRRLRD